MNKQMSDDFLWFTYFGITKTEAEKHSKEAINACIKRAYLDLCRTLKYKHSTSEIERGIKKQQQDMILYDKNKKALLSKINSMIKTAIDELLLPNHINCVKAFDDWHDDLRAAIMSVDQTKQVVKEHITCGQAQKWVNMTIKYMLVMGFWDNELKDVIPFFHVPLDSFVFSAAEKRKDEPVNPKSGKKFGLGIKRPGPVWSKMQESDYKDYCKLIRNSVDNPIEWESIAWLEQAMIAKEKQTND